MACAFVKIHNAMLYFFLILLSCIIDVAVYRFDV